MMDWLQYQELIRILTRINSELIQIRMNTTKEEEE
jgi:hypothetical protein